MSDKLSLPSVEFLKKKGIEYRVEAFSTDTEKGAANVARALGFREKQMIKTLIFDVDSGERILVMVGGDQTIKSGFLKKAVGSRNIKMASPQMVIDTTGYEIGSIPPFGWQPDGFRTFIEESMLEEEELGVGTGRWGVEIIMSPSNLVAASGAIVSKLVELESEA